MKLSTEDKELLFTLLSNRANYCYKNIYWLIPDDASEWLKRKNARFKGEYERCQKLIKQILE